MIFHINWVEGPLTRFVIVEKSELTDRITSFVLKPEDGSALPAWTAGAHIDLELGNPGARSYSLIEWPGDTSDVYRIAVQREPEGDGGSIAVHELSAGDVIEVSEPKNSFELLDGDEPVALIAGGIGVTPLISMATRLSASGRPFTFHYTGRSAGVMACRERLGESFSDQLICYFDDQAPIDLHQTVEQIRDHRLYVCGPKGMIEAVRSAAEAAGIPSDKVHVELFTSAAPVEGDKPFEVEVSSSGDVFTIPPGRTIIEVLEENGVDLMYDCQRGDCGICQTDVLEGVPDHRDVVLSEAEKESGKVMQICVSRALSERLVLDL
jgi:vanillate O-demethylase ferredoxin subunit